MDLMKIGKKYDCLLLAQMKKIVLLLLVFLLFSSFSEIFNSVSASTVDNSWATKSNMPTARGFLGIAVVNCKIYAIGGNGPIGVNEEYDPSTDMWTSRAPMPIPYQSFAIAVCQGKVYCIGGLHGAVGALNQVYDPLTDSWQSKASMPTGRYGAQAQTIDNKVYVIGGVRLLGYTEGYEQLNVTEVYDPSSDTWTTKAPMPNSDGYVSAVIGSDMYTIGSKTQIYDPKTDTWSATTAPPIGIGLGANGISAVAASTTGLMAPKRIYVYNGTYLQVYDPQSESWTFASAPPTSRQYLGIGNVNDTLYFIGGMTNDPSGLPWYPMFLHTNEQYTPVDYGTLQGPSSSQQAAVFSILLIAVPVAVISLVAIGIALYIKKHKR